MEWLDPEESEIQFVDAERVWRVLDAVTNAPNLYEMAAVKFVVPIEAPDLHIDEQAFKQLVADEFLEVPIQLRNEIEKLLVLEGDGERTRESLGALYRKLKTMAVQLRHAGREADKSGFLRSKTEKWEQQNRKDELERQFQDLTLKRRRMESDLEKAGTLMRNLLDQIYRDQRLREAAWYAGMPVILTHHGRFLLDYLNEMNPANFRGRSLAEILEIGPSLA